MPKEPSPNVGSSAADCEAKGLVPVKAKEFKRKPSAAHPEGKDVKVPKTCRKPKNAPRPKKEM